MSVYNRAQQTALRLLTKYGQVLTLTTQASGAYDTATGSVAVTGSSQSAIGAVFDYSTHEIDQSIVLAGDKRLYLSPLLADGSALVPPSIDDTVTVNGITYTIKKINALSPAGTPVLYDCNVRA